MGEMHMTRGDKVHRVYVLDGMSSTQSSTTTIPQNIVVERGARVDIVVLVFPGVSADIKLDVRLTGEGAEANVYGAYVCGGDEKVKIAVDMYHDVPHCNSRQLFKGIAGGASKVDFYGKIIVAQDAQRTEAYQENHNILLTDGAKVDTKPQLAKVRQMISFIAPVLEHVEDEVQRESLTAMIESDIRNIIRNV